MKQYQHFFIGNAAALIALVMATGAASAAGKYGSITGRIQLHGMPPEHSHQTMRQKYGSSVPSFCHDVKITDPSLTVNPENKGVCNVIVYMRKISKQAIHPDLQKSKTITVEFNQKQCMSSPRCLIVRTDQQVLVRSHDAVDHCIRVRTIFNRGQRVIVRPRVNPIVKLQRLSTPEPIPVSVKSDFYPWMKSNWLIVDHPYAAVTDKDGRFTIQQIPAGQHSFVVWHERVGYIDKSLSADIPESAQVDLGDIDVPVGRFFGSR